MSGLWILILGGFFQIFIGGEITQTAMAVGGAVLFSGKSEIKFLIIILDYIHNCAVRTATKFRENNLHRKSFIVTLWKNAIKRDHAQKFP